MNAIQGFVQEVTREGVLAYIRSLDLANFVTQFRFQTGLALTILALSKYFPNVLVNIFFWASLIFVLQIPVEIYLNLVQRKLTPLVPSKSSYALVTGGSTGIGLDTALDLGKQGFSVILVARSASDLDAAKKSFKSAYPALDAIVIAMDLGQPGQAAKLVEQVESELKQKGKDAAVDILINNAGFGSNGPFAEETFSKIGTMVNLNMLAPLELTRLLLPGMIERKRGRIVNVGSIAGQNPMPLEAEYGASKAFVNSFSQALNLELYGTGVSCSVVTPGPVRTRFAATANMENALVWKLPYNVVECETVGRIVAKTALQGEPLVWPGVGPCLYTMTTLFGPSVVSLFCVYFLWLDKVAVAKARAARTAGAAGAAAAEAKQN